MDLTGGCEWVVEAHGCDASALQDLSKLRLLFAQLIAELSLHPLSETNWHQFPGERGITGLALLSESHLACHTFPEYGSLCLNLFCCRPRPQWEFEKRLTEQFAAASVHVRRIERPYTS